MAVEKYSSALLSKYGKGILGTMNNIRARSNPTTDLINFSFILHRGKVNNSFSAFRINGLNIRKNPITKYPIETWDHLIYLNHYPKTTTSK